MRKRILTFALALLLVLALLPTVAFAAELTRVSKLDAHGNVKYGFADSNGNIIIAEQYDEAEEFYGGRIAKVKKNGLWGCIDERGYERVPIKYSDIRDDYSNEFGLVVCAVQNQEGLWGVYDSGGTRSITPMYEKVKVFGSDKMRAIFGSVVYSKWSDGEVKWGLKTGVKDIPCTNYGTFYAETVSYDGTVSIAVVGTPASQEEPEKGKLGIWAGIKTEEVSDIIELVPPQYADIRPVEYSRRADSPLPGGVTYSAIVGQYDPAAGDIKYGYLVDGELQKPMEEITDSVYGKAEINNPSFGVNDAVGLTVSTILLAFIAGLVFLAVVGKKKTKENTHEEQ